MVLALLEHDDEGVIEESLQMLTLPRRLADATDAPVHAAAIGEDVDLPDAYGIEVFHPVTIDDLGGYAPAAWAAALEAVADDCGADAVVAAGTDRGNEVLAHLGAQTDRPMVANCLEVTPEDDGYELVRQRWGGSLLERATLSADRALVTTAVHELPIETTEAADVAVEPANPSVPADRRGVTVDRFEPAEEEGISLKDADVVIGGGRGVGSAEGFEVLEDLAGEIGAAVGSSRAAVNEGWRPHDDQIGQTGEKISPTIYIACGISGAVQHMVGCKGAEHILAVNTDPEAGIMQKATWAVVADLHEVIPAVTEEVRERRD